MNPSSLPPEDLPPTEATRSDRLLSRELDRRLSQFFEEACQRDGTLQAVLSQCRWLTAAQPYPSTLIIYCPSLAIGWQVLQHLGGIGRLLEATAIARIRICPPPTEGTPLDIRVDELSLYDDSY
ncbi:hypothetical protein [Oscillatoria sp. FACHB-1406]|uniref:hypothetical protein n=1 Tax=Oscillatoria sp. FACHB-1406 TaxID=2692846 RepID=UPI001689BBF9|nr:hypothetical protein [Oscillatoria sp. FACHB-1406]MBD2577776.1 hypothetical protein [Oscillatoria sp. FACHB-1406]